MNPNETATVIQGQANFSNVYYPPTGQSLTPSVGLPMEISYAGTIPLPILGEVALQGLTVDQAAKLIAKQCVEQKIVQEGKEYVYLTLVRSRVIRVMVVRDEAPSDMPTFLAKQAPPYTKRGHAQS